MIVKPPNEKIKDFLTKAYKVSYNVGLNNSHLDLWFYQQVMSELKNAFSDDKNILYLDDKANLSDIKIPKDEKRVIIYDSGDDITYMPDNKDVCSFKRLCCIALIDCNAFNFDSNAPFQLGLEVSRHTIATIKNHATHFILPFDILLYLESYMIKKHGVEALSSNLFNQDGYLFSPHITPSIVTGALMRGDLKHLSAFIAQPKALRSLCSDMNLDIDDRLDNRDINEDALLALKVFKNRYFLPINMETIDELEKLEHALQQDFDEISVKIGSDEVKITKSS